MTGLYAQGGFTFVGGINMASVKYNDSDIQDEVDISMKMGINVGIESAGGPLTVGLAYVQRGAEVGLDIFGQHISGSDTYNYLTAYIIYPHTIQEGLSAFGGLQMGKCLGGEAELEGESDNLDGADFKLDYGLLVGANIMLNQNIGIRGSYYLGFADVAKDFDSDENWKNRGIGLTLLYKM